MRPLSSLLLASVIVCSNLAAQTFLAKEKSCFICKGNGAEKCKAGCANGKQHCPSPCLKLHMGKWEKMKVAGHHPDELWQTFSFKTAEKSGSMSWSQAHVGEIIDARPGIVPVNRGKCTTCKGTTKVNCDKCKGVGTTTCFMCDGKKKVPESWTETNNPKIDSDPNYIRFTDGRVIRGKIIMTMGDTVVIKPEQGKNIETTKDKIVAKPSPAKK